MKPFKQLRKICLIALAAIGIVTGRAVAQPGYDVPVESFYDELAPYGEWSQYPGYGDVWRPNADPNFQPYASNGHWVVTEYGNTWVSDYDWGWAPFHYGRWIYDPAYGGWLWVPGSDWGPAWVSWRSGGGYYGWAPLGPGANFNLNINIPAPYWTFVPQIYITSPRLYSYCVPRPRVVNIYQNTTIINNVYRSNNRAYNYGPQRVEIERVTRRSVPVYRVDYRDRPGRTVVSNGSVGFYRPNASVTNRRDYGRADRSDNRNYGNYTRGGGGYNATNRGYDRPEVPRASPGSGSRYDQRGTYTRGATPNADYGTATPNPGSYTTPNRRERVEPTPNSGGYSVPNRPDRYGPSRGSYSPAPSDNPAPVNESPQRNRSGYPAPGTAAPGGYPQQPTRTYERPNRPQSSENAPIAAPMPGRRADGNYQRPDNREAASGQRRQESGARQRGDQGQFTPGERPSRGPR